MEFIVSGCFMMFHDVSLLLHDVSRCFMMLRDVSLLFHDVSRSFMMFRDVSKCFVMFRISENVKNVSLFQCRHWNPRSTSHFEAFWASVRGRFSLGPFGLRCFAQDWTPYPPIGDVGMKKIDGSTIIRYL